MKGQVGRFPIDHVIPRSRGGVSNPSNLALACIRCNGAKWKHTDGVDPMTGEKVPLFNPRAASWAQHFRWSDSDPCVVMGITPCGRATVIRLQLNHPEMLLVRRLLTELGLMTTTLS
jgi:hypothetical protein